VTGVSTQLLDLVTCTCAVTAPDAAWSRMQHFVAPFVVTTLPVRPDIALTVLADGPAVAELRCSIRSQMPLTSRSSHPEQRYSVWQSGDGSREVLLPEGATDHAITIRRNHLTVCAESPSIAARIAVRVVRQLIMRGGEAQGGRSIHAGAVNLDGRGVLVAGRSGAGKTSVLTHLIEHYQARPVSNDRSAVVRSSDQSWRAVGVPLAWRYTPEGVNGSIALSSGLAQLSPVRGTNLIDRKIEITPYEVSRLLDVPFLPAVEISQLVILMRSTVERSRRVDAVSLKEYVEFGDADFFAEDWLNIRPALKKEGWLQDSDKWWSEFSAAIPIRVLSWAHVNEMPGLASIIVEGARH
jgi:hypothetical protein